MRILVAISAAVLLASTLFAQQAAAPDTTKGTYVSAADVATAVAKLGKNPLESAPILKMGPYNLNVEHRLAAPAQQASIHDKDAELFYVMDGGATLVTGGKLVEGVQTGDNWRGKAIEGGTAQKMSKGDFMMVPPGVPHWFTNIQGTITEMSIHLPMK
jgi:quercetin dioxygenase-like cupin family protein